jgi:uncharacterized protein (TIGR00255 family)
MIRSMTGYGRAAQESESLRATVSVRSLNHRYLDLTVHLSRRLQPLEGDIKRVVQQRISRGRVELTVQAALAAEEAEVHVVARPLVAGLVRALRCLQAEHALAGEVTVSDVARFPGALEVQDPPEGLPEAHREALLGLVGQALAGLEEMRAAEGRHVQRDLEAALGAIAVLADRLEELTRSGQETRRTTLFEKARGLAQELGLDEPRLYQEIARLVDRHDVMEEVQRLRSHLAQARATLGEAGPSGKRLDFLAQELAREANTIGSKAASAQVVQEVVGLKGEIERFREQVQNVE